MNEDEVAAGLAPTPSYRYADRVGNRLFVAGQVPQGSGGEIVGAGDPRLQARQCVRNVVALVADHGFSIDDIHQLTIYVVGTRDDLAAAWSEVAACFDHNVPPATLLGVALLGYEEQVVEIDAVVERA